MFLVRGCIHIHTQKVGVSGYMSLAKVTLRHRLTLYRSAVDNNCQHTYFQLFFPVHMCVCCAMLYNRDTINDLDMFAYICTAYYTIKCVIYAYVLVHISPYLYLSIPSCVSSMCCIKNAPPWFMLCLDLILWMAYCTTLSRLVGYIPVYVTSLTMMWHCNVASFEM